mmetsp:Transcript_24969/g.87005  ORF Transcript_24969/g.87005 Transcript_24969/m.87005 type:complete len:302 (+) Transcript_24969:1049-1954(+)
MCHLLHPLRVLFVCDARGIRLHLALAGVPVPVRLAVRFLRHHRIQAVLKDVVDDEAGVQALQLPILARDVESPQSRHARHDRFEADVCHAERRPRCPVVAAARVHDRWEHAPGTATGIGCVRRLEPLLRHRHGVRRELPFRLWGVRHRGNGRLGRAPISQHHVRVGRPVVAAVVVPVAQLVRKVPRAQGVADVGVAVRVDRDGRELGVALADVDDDGLPPRVEDVRVGVAQHPRVAHLVGRPAKSRSADTARHRRGRAESLYEERAPVSSTTSAQVEVPRHARHAPDHVEWAHVRQNVHPR